MGYGDNGVGGRPAGFSGLAAVLALGVVALVAGGLVRLTTGGHHLGYAFLIGTGLVGGLLLAFAPRGERPLGSAVPPADGELASHTRRALATLDEVEHRQIDVGPEGPTVIVGPTGVVVVAAAVAAGEPAGSARIDPSRWAHLREVVGQVRSAASGGERPLNVRGLAVTSPGPLPLPPAEGDGALEVVPVDQLVDVVGEGALLPMSSVADAFERITRGLAPVTALSRR